MEGELPLRCGNCGLIHYYEPLKPEEEEEKPEAQAEEVEESKEPEKEPEKE